jgi:hypothetical protein
MALKEQGINLPEVAGHLGGVHGVLAPGYNPKETPDLFVRKIMQNQKRMAYTIAKYEEEEKAKFRAILEQEAKAS